MDEDTGFLGYYLKTETTTRPHQFSRHCVMRLSPRQLQSFVIDMISGCTLFPSLFNNLYISDMLITFHP